MTETYTNPEPLKWDELKPNRNKARRIASRVRAKLLNIRDCSWCEGSGYEVEPKLCPHCGGTGKVKL